MKKLLSVFVGLLCSVAVFAQTDFQELSLEEACKKAKTENKPICLDCYTSWCGPCKMLSPIVDEIAEEAPNGLKVCKVNIDDCPELAQQFQVMSIPTLVVMQDGKPVASSVGVRPKQKILQMIAEA